MYVLSAPPRLLHLLSDSLQEPVQAAEIEVMEVTQHPGKPLCPDSADHKMTVEIDVS